MYKPEASNSLCNIYWNQIFGRIFDEIYTFSVRKVAFWVAKSFAA